MDPFPHILSYGKGPIGREAGNYSPIEKWNERPGYLDGQWMFIDNYLILIIVGASADASADESTDKFL